MLSKCYTLSIRVCSVLTPICGVISHECTFQMGQRQEFSVVADGETGGAQSAVFLQRALSRRVLRAQQLRGGG